MKRSICTIDCAVFVFIVSFVILAFFSSCGNNSGTLDPDVLRGESGIAQVGHMQAPGDLESEKADFDAFGEFFSSTDGDDAAREIKPVPRVPIPKDESSVLGLSLTVLESEGAISHEAIRYSENALTDGGIELVLSASDAGEFAAVPIEIRFDVARFNPVSWSVCELFGGDPKEAYSFGTKGNVAAGAGFMAAAVLADDHVGLAIARVRPDLIGWLSGNGAIATVVFENTPYELPVAESQRAASEVAREPEYFWDWDYGVAFPVGTTDDKHTRVYFSSHFAGDADGDGEVTVADITPIAMHYLKTMQWTGGLVAYRFDEEKDHDVLVPYDEFRADLDKSGEIGIPDITEIVLAYNRRYHEDKLAYRQDDGEWQLEDYGNPYPSDDDIHVCGLYGRIFNYFFPDIPFDPIKFDYGLGYENMSTGEISALPFAEWEFIFLLKDRYLLDVNWDESERVFELEFDFLGDWDSNYIVEVPDVTPIAENAGFPLNEEGLGFWAASLFHDDIRNLVDFNNNGIYEFYPAVEYRLLVEIIHLNYLMHIEGAELSYYTNAGDPEPFRTDFLPTLAPVVGYSHEHLTGAFRYEESSIHYLACRPADLESTAFVEVTLIIDGSNLPDEGLKITWPTRFLVEPPLDEE